MRGVVFLFAFVICFSFVFAGLPIVEFDYDFNTSFKVDNRIHYSDSILLRIRTPNETSCFYTLAEGMEPSNEFDNNYGTRHEKVFDNLKNGVNRYYIRCGDEGNKIMSVSFNKESEVYADIRISKNPPLKAGVYDLVLRTSTHIIGEPELRWSFDGIVYKPIPLAGSGRDWKGHLIIERDIGEAIGSFRFKATGLNGKEGTRIVGDKIFVINTRSPEMISTIEAIGSHNEVKLKWFTKEDIDEFYVYRSEDSGVSHTDFFKSVGKNEFFDHEVVSGRTYFYRVASVNNAGNIGPLSREIEATALLSNTTEQTGLRPNLIGRVDNLLTEINSFKDDVIVLRGLNDDRAEKEKMLFSVLGFDDELRDSLSELDSLTREVELFKKQDLSEVELDKKLNSARLKLNIIRGRAPESIMVIDEIFYKNDLSEDSINYILLEYGQDFFSERELRNSVLLTRDFIKENEITIDSSAYNLRIGFVDGSNREVSYVEHNVNAQVERSADSMILLSVPREVGSLSRIDFFNRNYDVLKDDFLVSFDADTKKISYRINEHININRVEDVLVVPVRIPSDEIKTGFITGASIFNLGNYRFDYIGYVSLGLVFLILLFYFILLRLRKGLSDDFILLNEKINKLLVYKDENNVDEFNKVYRDIKEIYNKLSKKEKSKVYKKINMIKKK